VSSNPDQAVETIRSTGQLEFVDPQGVPHGPGHDHQHHQSSRLPPTEAQAAIEAGTVAAGRRPYPDQVFETVMTGDILRNALATQGQLGQWEIGFDLTSDGSDEFYAYTRDHVGEPLVIVLDGVVLSAPVINAAIQDTGVITGQFTNEEADSLAVQMRYGALPVALNIVDISTIGATLGKESVESSLSAGIIGMIGVLLFMLIIYRCPAFWPIWRWWSYVIFNIAIFKLIPVTLTLAGIAGFLLSIGMAVDANILIFERMKEELRVGRSLQTGR
jgi:preprotein translocase subunit SecD